MLRIFVGTCRRCSKSCTESQKAISCHEHQILLATHPGVDWWCEHSFHRLHCRQFSSLGVQACGAGVPTYANSDVKVVFGGVGLSDDRMDFAACTQ